MPDKNPFNNSNFVPFNQPGDSFKSLIMAICLFSSELGLRWLIASLGALTSKLQLIITLKGNNRCLINECFYDDKDETKQTLDDSNLFQSSWDSNNCQTLKLFEIFIA